MAKEKKDLQRTLDAMLAESQPISIADVYDLSDMPPEMFDQFMQRWPQVADERRRVIARHMADISEENFQVNYVPFFAPFLNDPLPEVRQAALDGLWDADDARLIAPIIKLMEEDGSADVRQLAAATLGHFVLMAEWGEINQRYEGPIITALMGQLRSPDTHAAVRRAALESVAAAATPEINRMIEEAYESTDQASQQSALFAMGRTADARWIPTLIDEMENPDSEMRAEAARAIGSIGDSRGVPQLIELAYNDEELDVQLVAIHALGEIGGDSATRALSDLLEDPEAEELYDAIEEAMEGMMWTGGDIDLSLIDWKDDDIDE